MLDVSKLTPPPAGFGACGRCAYLDVGSAAICFACASQRLDPLPDPRCQICEQALNENGECGNPVCNWPHRAFGAVWAISMMTGALQAAIKAYKYPPYRRAWAAIFGRVLVGFLDDNAAVFSSYELVVASPTYVGSDGRPFDHVGLILERAAIEAGGRWPLDLGSPATIVQTAPTESFAGKTWQQRRAIAEGPLRQALSVPDPSRIASRAILLFDDVFTSGLRTHVLAQCLLDSGAGEVSAVVLARQPYGGSSA